MSTCFRIGFTMEAPKDFLNNFVQKHARSLGLEGTVQLIEGSQVKIVACGPKDSMEQFIDILHKKGAQESIEDIEIEPFLKDKDYRNVFRVIE